MKAKPCNEYVPVLYQETLPNRVQVLIVPCANYPTFAGLPNALEYQGKIYGRTGWNSDRYVGYYRTDALIAKGRS